MVAAVCSWHEQHRAAAAAIQERLDRGERLAIPAPALVETYAVLTRLPPPHRLAPADAWTLVKTNFVRHRTVVALTGAAYTAMLDGLARDAVAGGRTYDAVIAQCARRAKAATLLTFDRRHFDPPASGVAVVEP